MAISRRNEIVLRVLLGLALLAATWVSLTPRPPALPDVNHADKWAHLATYLVLSLLADLAWSQQGFGSLKWGSLLTYGLVIELLQSQIPNRVFSLPDIAANAAGVTLYALVMMRGLQKSGVR